MIERCIVSQELMIDSLFIEEKSNFDDIYAPDEEVGIDLEVNEVSRYLQLDQHANPLQWRKDRQSEFST